MISAAELMAGLTGCQVTTVTGVPCSFLTPVINRAIGDPCVRYVSATQEGEAVAIAAGAWLGGGLGAVISQNSGLGNMVNPLTSLLHPARIPAVLLVTWRGEPGRPDEPQHRLMGEITPALLDLMDVEWTLLPNDSARLGAALDAAARAMSRRELPYALVIPKDTVADEELHEPLVQRRRMSVTRHGLTNRPPARWQALEALLATLPPEAAVISTTGYTSRELYTLDDRERNFYLVGAMGSASAVGLGVTMHSSRPVVVVDGDGALLMRMGSLATIACHGRDNLIHVVLDNGVHDSTGAQRTLSGAVDLVAAANGYGQVHECATLDQFAAALSAALAGPGPSLVHLRIKSGSIQRLGRPKVTPEEVARRFRAFLTSASPVPVGSPA